MLLQEYVVTGFTILGLIPLISDDTVERMNFSIVSIYCYVMMPALLYLLRNQKLVMSTLLVY